MADEGGGVGSEPLTFCEDVGEPAADLAGIGILVGFAGQAFISLALATWVFFVSRHGAIDIRHDEGTQEREIEKKRIESVTDILMIGSDIQMATGYAYLITALLGLSSASLYHLRLSYEVLCFVGVCNSAALVCWMFCVAKTQGPDAKYGLDVPLVTSFATQVRQKKTLQGFWETVVEFMKSGRLSGRHRLSLAFAALFIAFSVLLGKRLKNWDLNPEREPRNCYVTTGVLAPGASQPATDEWYLGVTASWSVVGILASVFGSARRRRFILGLALLQFPVHLYMMIMLKVQNHPTTERGETDNSWDFGQTTAMVLLGATLAELYRKGVEFWKFYRSEEVRQLSVSDEKGSSSQRKTNRDANGLSKGSTIDTQGSGIDPYQQAPILQGTSGGRAVSGNTQQGNGSSIVQGSYQPPGQSEADTRRRAEA